MKQIDFHYNVMRRTIYACKLVKKVTGLGLTAALWSRDEAFLKTVYDDLWRFEDMAFIAHAWAGSPTQSESSVVFSTDIASLTGRDVLVLLDDNVPDNWREVFDGFDRVVDIVGKSPEELTASRARYRLYKASGVPLKAYDRSKLA